MKKIYPDAIKYLPQNVIPSKVNPIQVSCFVDSDHTDNKIAYRSQYGIILHYNKYTIIWYSKRQATVDK